MKKHHGQIFWLILLAGSFLSCKNNRNAARDADTQATVKAVRITADSIAHAISTQGPVAWLNYFEDDPGFFMVSNGALAFKNYASGRTFIRDTLAANFKSIRLTWNNYKIAPLTKDYASFGADFHENIILANSSKLQVSGYVTATLHFDGKQWKIRDMSWSLKAPDAR